MGRLLSPRHTLPPNTTCTYYFHGFPNDLIWLSFTSHHLQLLQPVTHENLTAFGQVSYAWSQMKLVEAHESLN